MRKEVVRGLRRFSPLLLLVTLASCSDPLFLNKLYNAKIPVSSISLDPSSAVLAAGSTLALTAEVLPAAATDKSLVWLSTNELIASVDDVGQVTAVSAGMAMIAASSADGARVGRCAVTVSAPAPGSDSAQGVRLDKSSLRMMIGGSAILLATVLPYSTQDRSVAWASSNGSIATVSPEGLVAGIGEGSATIRATSNAHDAYAECAVSVLATAPVPVESVGLSSTSLSIQTGHSFGLTATVLPSNSTVRSPVWTSEDPDIASVDSSGLVGGIAIGQTRIWGGADGVGASCSVAVYGSVEMVSVAGGSFQMGSSTGQSNEQPIHPVTLSSFTISKYEITQDQYQPVMGVSPSALAGASHPVENVSWYDVVEFCIRISEQDGLESVYAMAARDPATGYPIASATVTADLSKNGYRLPTEAEWEYAARGGANSGGYKYSGSNIYTEVASWGGSSHSVVGAKAPNELGIYDMSGNVWELCHDWLDYGITTQDPIGSFAEDSTSRRGGCSAGAYVELSSTYRLPWTLGTPDSTIGFRVARRN